MPPTWPDDVWDATTLIWTQTQNPLSERNKDMKPTNVTLTPGNLSMDGFDGLSLSSGLHTLLDGNVGSSWWFSIGYVRSFNATEDVGQPGYRAYNETGLIASKTQLFISRPYCQDTEG